VTTNDEMTPAELTRVLDCATGQMAPLVSPSGRRVKVLREMVAARIEAGYRHDNEEG
jgi:hypothetical protein